MSRVVFCNADESRRVLVNTVYDTRAHHTADARKGTFAVIEKCGHERACVMSRRRMYYHSLRLVDDDNISVFVNNVERDILRSHVKLLRLRESEDQYVAGDKLVFLLYGHTVFC